MTIMPPQTGQALWEKVKVEDRAAVKETPAGDYSLTQLWPSTPLFELQDWLDLSLSPSPTSRRAPTAS